MRRGIVIFVLVLFTSSLYLGVPLVHASSWWDASWEYKVKLTLDEAKVDADLTDFPVLVYLNSSRVDWAHVQDDLDDLRFVNSTDNGLLSAELEKSVTNSEAWIWVKVPAVSGTVDTVIYVYYGNVAAASAWDAENVWEASAMMVQHMKSNTNTTILDSTANNNDGTLSSVGTFGSSAGTSYTTVPANQMYGSLFTSPADANGVVNSITWYGRAVSGTGNSKAILVDASLDIIAVSDVTATTETEGEWTNTFSSPPTITANTVYYLMMIFDVSTRFYYGTGTTNQGALDATNSYTTPTSPTDATNNNNQYRIRAVYTDTITQINGKVDSALIFDGDYDYCSMPDSNSLDTIVCFEAWVNPIAYVPLFGGNAHLLVTKHLTYRHGLGITYNENPNNFGAFFHDGIGGSEVYWAIPDYTLWYHIVSQWNSVTGKTELYINGELKGEGIVITGPSGNNTEPLRIAGGLTAVNRYSKAIIDEVRCYNAIKSAAWIKANYNSGADTLITYGTELYTVQITITSTPGTGAGFITIDAGAITTPHTYTWITTETYTLGANSPVTIVAGQSRYTYTLWNDTGAQIHIYTVPLTNKTVMAIYALEYYFNVTDIRDTATGEAWYTNGTIIESTVTTPIIINANSRYDTTGWTGTGSLITGGAPGSNTTGTFTITAYTTCIWNWVTQYLLSLTTSPATGPTATGGGWYNAGANATLTATTPTIIGPNVFEFFKWTWKLNGTAQNASITNPQNFTVTAPITAVGVFKVNGSIDDSGILVWGVVVGVIACGAFMWGGKRRRRYG